MLPTLRKKKEEIYNASDELELNNEDQVAQKKIETESAESKILKSIEARQAEILEIVKEMRKPKTETRQEVLNPAKSDEQVAAELLLEYQEKNKKKKDEK